MQQGSKCIYVNLDIGEETFLCSLEFSWGDEITLEGLDHIREDGAIIDLTTLLDLKSVSDIMFEEIESYEKRR